MWTKSGVMYIKVYVGRREIKMNNVKKIAVMTALAGVFGLAGVSANGVGYVNLDMATKNHPQIQAYNNQVNAVVNKYAPQIQKEVAEAQKITNQAQQQAFINREIVPLQNQQQQEVARVVLPLFQSVGNAAEQVRAKRGLTVVVSATDAVLAIDPKDNNVIDITADVIALLKK